MQDEQQKLLLFCIVPGNRLKVVGNGQRTFECFVKKCKETLTMLTVTVMSCDVISG